MEIQLAGRTALVTGGGSGIGAAICLALAQCGVDVALTYFSQPDAAEQTAQAVREVGAQAHTFALDATDAAQVRRVVSAAAQALGGHIDILVNNAGHLVARVPFAQMSDEHWRQVMAVNLDSAFYVTRAVLPFMQGWGRIINMSSLAGRNGGGAGASAYATAKAGLLGLTRALAKEMGLQGITVNALAPGLILDTAFHATFTPPEAIQATIASLPVGFGGVPDDVAGAVVYLVSDLARFVTGEVVEINGGAWFA